MKGTFTLKITLGNEEMRTYAQVGQALRAVDDTLKWAEDKQSGTIKDVNGNTVGEWSIEEEETEEVYGYTVFMDEVTLGSGATRADVEMCILFLRNLGWDVRYGDNKTDWSYRPEQEAEFDRDLAAVMEEME